MSVWRSVGNYVKAYFGKLGIGNYSEFEADGTLVYKGDATVWTDMRFPLTQDKQGANLKPDFDETNCGLLFPQNDTTEIIYAICQFDHSKKLDSNIYPHIHFIQAETNLPTFKLMYRWYDNSGNPGTFQTISTDDGDGAIFTYDDSGGMLQILPFPKITGLVGEHVSSNIDLKLYRDDNLVTGDVLSKFFDIHYEKDTEGSRQEYSK